MIKNTYLKTVLGISARPITFIVNVVSDVLGPFFFVLLLL